MAKPSLLIIDDEAVIRQTIRDIFEFEKYEVEEAGDGIEGLAKIKDKRYDVVLLDIKMPEMDGMEVLEKIQILQPDLPVVMISGHGTLENAVEAVKMGAYDFISKPPDLNRLLITVRNAHEKTQQVKTIKKLRKKVTGVKEIVGESNGIADIKELIEKIAPTDARVLVTGENGTGKELVARMIHAKSDRSGGPIVEVNCAAIPSELIESELFGHEKGSFTSAHKQRIGKFEQANGGTLFLDEVGDMSLSAQAKVLRALQESKITRVGGDKELDVDVRVVAATNKNLMKAIDKGEFRMDLYHRLSVMVMHLPSLNDRSDDIPLLVDHFVTSICEEYGKPEPKITKTAYDALKNINWTGNIRELRNVVERLIILCPEKIDKKDVEQYSNKPAQGAELLNVYKRYDHFDEFKGEMEKGFISYHLDKHDWNTEKTARELNMSEDDLKLLVKRFELVN
ncbi:MAG: sigma-54 dependent transcriptional regulator [Saprospiraceae bacterium]|nr:sigma-54 dependent transcriptional regulator [Saprospiraceae bacterium]